MKLALGFVVSVVLGLAFVSGAGAQQPDIQIAQLQCHGDPELVVIENRGDAPQQFADWKLRSDPPDSEVFDLTVLDTLEPGASISLPSGPSADGDFMLSQEFLYRDNDTTDYARIVNDIGAVIHQVNCATSPTGASSPTTTSVPSPEASPAADVPKGGGAPPVSGSPLSPLLLTLVGGSMVAAGLATLSLSGLRVSLTALAGHGATTALGQNTGLLRPWHHASREDAIRENRLSPVSDLVRLRTASAAIFVRLFVLPWRRSG